VNVETVYNDYWNSGLHVTKEWQKREFDEYLGPLIGLNSVLDYGCGMGWNYQRQLAAAVKQYTGADVSEVAIATTRQRGLTALPINPGKGTIEVPTGSFDGAVCSEVFEHLYEPLNAARELHRVLKPGGVLVVTVPNFGYHAWRLLALLRAQVPSEPEDKVGNRYHGVHIRFLGKLMLQRLLRDGGFTDIRIGSFGAGSIWDVFCAAGPLTRISIFARKHLPAPFHLRFLQDVWPNVFAERLRAVARKPE